MVFRANQLRDAFEGQGEAGFMVYTYACFDPLEEVLRPGYFQGLDRRSSWCLSAGRPA